MQVSMVYSNMVREPHTKYFTIGWNFPCVVNIWHTKPCKLCLRNMFWKWKYKFGIKNRFVDNNQYKILTLQKISTISNVFIYIYAFGKQWKNMWMKTPLPTSTGNVWATKCENWFVYSGHWLLCRFSRLIQMMRNCICYMYTDW